MDRVKPLTALPRFSVSRAVAGFLAWLLRRDAAFRQAQHMDRLSAHMRRDIGLPPVQKPGRIDQLW